MDPKVEGIVPERACLVSAAPSTPRYAYYL